MLRVILIVFAISLTGSAASIAVAERHRASIDAVAAGTFDTGQFAAAPAVLADRQAAVAGHRQAVARADRAFIVCFLLAIGSGVAFALCAIAKILGALIRAARRPSGHPMGFSEGGWPDQYPPPPGWGPDPSPVIDTVEGAPMGILNRKNAIARLCEETGNFAFLKAEGVTHYVVPNGPQRRHRLEIKHDARFENVTLQGFFPIRFSLEKTPSGLFARVLMRSFELHFASWCVIMTESCEAGLCVRACVPRAALDSRLLDRVCTEIIDELEGFQKELREKFAYTPGQGIVYPEAPRSTGTAIATQHARYPAPRRGG